MKIGVFGGTFNPPHLGHKRLAAEFKTKLNLDKILIIPTFNPPHKMAKELVSTGERIELCNRCFDTDFFEVSDIEILRQGKSYTVQTLEQLHEIYKDSEFYLIVGSDMLLTFDQWFRWEDILKLCTICVATRENEVSIDKLKSYAKNTLKKDEVKGEIIITKISPFECSSTMVREKIKNDEALTDVLSENVIEYIESRGLYNGKNWTV